ncbi:MAG: ribosome assembly cofactor RimP [Bacteroidales bacterium]|nr:ribosome assembly cofactor RimP [Bacteroidales bacterium]
MINKEIVIKLAEEKLDEKMFLVDVTVSKSNVINVFVDSFDGITIDKCIEISRHIEHNLDREDEDFELQVSSPGITENFRVKQQYFKYKEREIELVTNEDQKLKGLLKEAVEEGIILETVSNVKIEGQKRKQPVIKEYKFKYDEIKNAKAVITFK